MGPQELWEKITNNLEENDLFPLALSCRYFRQKQKELVARMGQNGKHCCALRTNIRRQYIQRQQASADYLRFCYKEIVLSEFFPQRAKWIMKLAAYHGDLTLLQEHEKKFELDAEVFYSACAGGNLETLKWLRSKGCPWSGWACSSAAKHGHLEILKWLRSEGCPWDEGTFTAAVERGHLQMLKWLRSKGCPGDWRSGSRAAGGGHLETLKWLRSEGCPWNQYACSNAACGGHFDVLKYLHANGCPWGNFVCEEAVMNGHLDLLKWAIDNGCPYKVNSY